MQLSGGDRLGPYEILALIGAGGMGEVYHARDTALRRDVALKVLPEGFARDPERAARFRREAEVLASLNHPGIAQVYGFVEAGETRGIAMEFVDGAMLAGPLPVDAALDYARQMIEALEYAHDRGIVHRDLKPANVKITSEGKLKLLDFGLAKAVEDPAPPSNPSFSPTLTLGHTRAGQILGTPAYMAPEQIGGKPADRRSDIFSFGAVLYEMLTGQCAFTGSSTEDILASVLKLEPDWSKLPKDTPAHVRRVLERCLTKDRSLRLQAIGEARIALLNREPSAAAPARDRLSWIWPTAVAVAIAAAAALAFVHFRESPVEAPLYRYTLPLPENSEPAELALSPDGRMLAVTTLNVTSALWVYDLVSGSLRKLPDTERADSPVWSLDSRSIIFRARSWKRQAIEGGPAEIILTESVGGQGSSIDASGRVLAARGSSIFRIDSGKRVDFRVRDKSGPILRFPDAMQEGRRFLYSMTLGEDEAKLGIYLGSFKGKPDGSEDRRLLPDPSSAHYMPPDRGENVGHLFFVRGGSLVAQPVDPESLAPRGDTMPLGSEVSSNSVSTGEFKFSVSASGVLAFVSAPDQVIKLDWYDRSGKKTGAVTEGSIHSFALSRDGNRLALSRRNKQGQRALFIRDLDRGNEPRFTEYGSDVVPVWSARDDILFSSARSGTTGLFVKPANGLAAERLVQPNSGAAYAYDWTKDDRGFLFWRSSGIFVKTGDAEPVALVNGRNAVNPQLSPDNRWLAYTQFDSSAGGQVFVQPFSPEGKPGKRVQVSTTLGAYPRWSRDGKELYFVSRESQSASPKLMAVKIRAGNDFQFDRPVELFDFPSSLLLLAGEVEAYDVSPDGRFLIPSVEPGPGPALTLVTNWRKALRK